MHSASRLCSRCSASFSTPANSSGALLYRRSSHAVTAVAAAFAKESSSQGQQYADTRPPNPAQTHATLRAWFSLAWHDIADATARVSDIATVPWDDVDVEMRDSLSRGSSDVHTDIEPVRRVPSADDPVQLLHHLVERKHLGARQLEEPGPVSLGDH
jgi:hypothetical protein